MLDPQSSPIIFLQGIARRLIKAALKEAAKKREMRYSDLKKIERGVRRHFHDDITVVVLYLDPGLVRKTKNNVPLLSLRGGGGSTYSPILKLQWAKCISALSPKFLLSSWLHRLDSFFCLLWETVKLRSLLIRTRTLKLSYKKKIAWWTLILHCVGLTGKPGFSSIKALVII